jgi:hypothetical protein
MQKWGFGALCTYSVHLWEACSDTFMTSSANNAHADST